MELIELRKRNWFVRLFVWWWKADPEKLDVCKMFWGTLLSPLAIFGRQDHLLLVLRNWLVFLGLVRASFGNYQSALLRFAFAATFAALHFFASKRRPPSGGPGSGEAGLARTVRRADDFTAAVKKRAGSFWRVARPILRFLWRVVRPVFRLICGVLLVLHWLLRKIGVYFLLERVVWTVDGGASNVTRSIRAVKEDYCIKIKLVD